jgi:hypothetical protein
MRRSLTIYQVQVSVSLSATHVQVFVMNRIWPDISTGMGSTYILLVRDCNISKDIWQLPSKRRKTYILLVVSIFLNRCPTKIT